MFIRNQALRTGASPASPSFPIELICTECHEESRCPVLLFDGLVRSAGLEMFPSNQQISRLKFIKARLLFKRLVQRIPFSSLVLIGNEHTENSLNNNFKDINYDMSAKSFLPIFEKDTASFLISGQEPQCLSNKSRRFSENRGWYKYCWV